MLVGGIYSLILSTISTLLDLLFWTTFITQTVVEYYDSEPILAHPSSHLRKTPPKAPVAHRRRGVDPRVGYRWETRQFWRFIILCGGAVALTLLIVVLTMATISYTRLRRQERLYRPMCCGLVKAKNGGAAAMEDEEVDRPKPAVRPSGLPMHYDAIDIAEHFSQRKVRVLPGMPALVAH